MNHINRFFFLLPAFLLIHSVSIDAQPTRFKQYINKTHKFSFDIPGYWQIEYSKAQSGLICVPLTNKEKKIYRNCFEGMVFRLNFYNAPLDTVLMKEGSYTKAGGRYYTSDRYSDSIQTENIKGKYWKGIYHSNTCGINCKDTKFHGAGGTCDFLYFSNDNATVSMNTNGRPFDKKILKRLINTFRFN